MERSAETDEMMSAASAALGAADSTVTNVSAAPCCARVRATHLADAINRWTFAANPIVSSSCTGRPLPPPPPSHDRSVTLAAATASLQGFPESPGGDERLYDPVAVGDGGDDPGGLYDPAGEGDYEDAYQYMDPVAEGEEDDGMQGSASKRIIALYKEAERRKVAGPTTTHSGVGWRFVAGPRTRGVVGQGLPQRGGLLRTAQRSRDCTHSTCRARAPTHTRAWFTPCIALSTAPFRLTLPTPRRTCR